MFVPTLSWQNDRFYTLKRRFSHRRPWPSIVMSRATIMSPSCRTPLMPVFLLSFFYEKTRLCFEFSLLYVCPEPVLVKRWHF